MRARSVTVRMQHRIFGDDQNDEDVNAGKRERDGIVDVDVKLLLIHGESPLRSAIVTT